MLNVTMLSMSILAVVTYMQTALQEWCQQAAVMSFMVDNVVLMELENI